ncbi:MAG TPA: hypothetical protein VGC19_14690 [Rhodanobacter sp.]
MQTLKVSVSLPDATHPDMELRLSANDSNCNVVIALPMQIARPPDVVQPPGDVESPRDDDDYVLGGYAGI